MLLLSRPAVCWLPRVKSTWIGPKHRHKIMTQRISQYLSEKSLSGTADGLNEYTVGLDVFAKPASYDPRRESVVRMHVARLRQKLAEYYRTEGVDGPTTEQSRYRSLSALAPFRSTMPYRRASLTAARNSHRSPRLASSWLERGRPQV
jgi:hypothetical protein